MKKKPGEQILSSRMFFQMLSLGFGNVSFIQQVFFKSLKGLKTFFFPPLPVFPCNESMKALEYYTNNNTLKDDIKEATHM